MKGDTSGHQQWVKAVALDCDGDAVLVGWTRSAAACHTGDRTCFDADLLLPSAPRQAPESSRAAQRRAPGTVVSGVVIARLARVSGPRARHAGRPGDAQAARRRRDARRGLPQAGRRARHLPARVGRARPLAGRATPSSGVRAAATLTERDGQAVWLGDAAAGRADRRRPARRAARGRAGAARRRGTGRPPPLLGGLVGYLSYDRASGRIERLPAHRRGRAGPAGPADAALHRPRRPRPLTTGPACWWRTPFTTRRHPDAAAPATRLRRRRRAGSTR